MKNFYLDFYLEHATKIINYEKKEMIPIQNNKRNSCSISQRFCI